jgi:hypothetical protein
LSLEDSDLSQLDGDMSLTNDYFPLGYPKVPAESRNIPPGIHYIPPGDRDVPAGIRKIPPGNKQVPPGNRNISLGNRDIPPGHCEFPAGYRWISFAASPLAERRGFASPSGPPENRGSAADRRRNAVAIEENSGGAAKL